MDKTGRSIKLTLELLIKLERALTIEEYRWLKTQEYYHQCKVFDEHIGKENRKKMGAITSWIGRSKYFLYLDYYMVYNSKLGKVLR